MAANAGAIPGASLGGRKPEHLKIPELKQWLLCRGASTKGKKADLIARVNAYIKYGWDKNVYDPYGDSAAAGPVTSPNVVDGDRSSAALVYPEVGWGKVTEAYTSSDVPQFNMGHIVTYFVSRTVCDSLPATDLKSINKSAENLFRCGHVQDISVCSTSHTTYFRAKCVPEMRKDRVYMLALALQANSLDIVHAECGCPAGRGPHGSCKHIAALCYALVDFFRLGSLPEFLTCTEKLQQWNQPRAIRIDPIPVNQLGVRRRELLPPKNKSSGAHVIFDPRPLALREADPASLEELRCTLLTLGEPCGVLSVLVPCTKKVAHDHCYATCEQGCRATDSLPLTADLDISLYLNLNPISDEMILESLCLTMEQREELEKETRKQANSSQWHEARRYRITGSKCGRVVNQKERTVALLRFCLYPKPMLDPLPLPISWGRNNEMRACYAYVKHMQKHGHTGLEASPSGFVVHPEKGWLGASPDAWVTDPSCNPSQGIAEFKCPYSKRCVTPEEACKDHSFCSVLQDGKIQLKREHTYYHQVQLQLYVAFDLCHWCDFCIYTTKGIAVQRVFPDEVWKKNNCDLLDSYFFDIILPEMVNPQHKPSYIL